MQKQSTAEPAEWDTGSVADVQPLQTFGCALQRVIPKWKELISSVSATSSSRGHPCTVLACQDDTLATRDVTHRDGDSYRSPRREIQQKHLYPPSQEKASRHPSADTGPSNPAPRPHSCDVYACSLHHSPALPVPTPYACSLFPAGVMPATAADTT